MIRGWVARAIRLLTRIASIACVSVLLMLVCSLVCPFDISFGTTKAPAFGDMNCLTIEIRRGQAELVAYHEDGGPDIIAPQLIPNGMAGWPIAPQRPADAASKKRIYPIRVAAVPWHGNLTYVDRPRRSSLRGFYTRPNTGTQLESEGASGPARASIVACPARPAGHLKHTNTDGLPAGPEGVHQRATPSQRRRLAAYCCA
jgi:hypothetical protein